MSSLLPVASAAAVAYFALVQQTALDTDSDADRWRVRRRVLAASVLLYAVWFAYTYRDKHRTAVWGPSWAARFAASVCHFIGWSCGLTLTVKFEEEAGLKAEHRGLVAAVGPHGVFPMAMLGLGGFMFRRDSGYGVPGLIDIEARFAGASIVFMAPVVRELLLLMGVRDASRSTVRALLASNHSVAIQPGGIWEMVMSDSSQEALYFQRSLGFVRLALEAGRPLLPCYSFGENQVRTPQHRTAEVGG